MIRLLIKDEIYLVIMNTPDEDVSFEFIRDGKHLYRSNLRNTPEDELRSILDEMVDNGHLTLTEGIYSPTESGRDIFTSGGYVANYKRVNL